MAVIGEIGTLRRTEVDMEFVCGCTFDRAGHVLTGSCPIPLGQGSG
jgi:hypothetical protein